MINRPNFRTVIYTNRFEAELSVLDPNPAIADEFVRGVEWLLCRYPPAGAQVAPNSHVWMIPMTDAPITDPYTVYYTFDQNRVFLLSIQPNVPTP